MKKSLLAIRIVCFVHGAWKCSLGAYKVFPRPVYSPSDIIFSIKGENIIRAPKPTIMESFNNLITTIGQDYAKELKSNSKPILRYYAHINWADGQGGHEFLIVLLNGIPYGVDGQEGTVIPLKIHSYMRDIDFNTSYIVRLDNKVINTDIFKYNKEKYIKELTDEDLALLNNNGGPL